MATDTHFMIKKIVKACYNYTYFAVILTDFVLEKEKNFYSPVFSK